MMRNTHFLALLALTLTVCLTGCSDLKKKEAEAKAAAAAKPEGAAGPEAIVVKLTPEEAAEAEKQAVCPVGDSKLGSMGPPYKVSIKGRNVYLCCKGCEEELKADPEKFLAKLDEKKKGG